MPLEAVLRPAGNPAERHDRETAGRLSNDLVHHPARMPARERVDSTETAAAATPPRPRRVRADQLLSPTHPSPDLGGGLCRSYNPQTTDPRHTHQLEGNGRLRHERRKNNEQIRGHGRNG